MSSHVDVTQMLRRWSDGDERALETLLPALYDQLKQIAHFRLAGERSGHTLNTTALVHEAYIKMVDLDRVRWQDRAHFLAMAAKTMRRILVDYALSRKAQKRGGGAARVEFDEERLLPEDKAESILDLNSALERLEADYPRQGKAVELTYFGGLTLEEAAEAIGVSPATVMRDQRFAEAWLAREWRARE